MILAEVRRGCAPSPGPLRGPAIITGYAYSMGAIVFEAGDRRTMGTYSTMMLYSSQWTISGEDERCSRTTRS